VPEAVHHGLEVSATCEEPGCVGVPEIVPSDVEVKVGFGDGRQPDACAKCIPRDRCADTRGPQEVIRRELASGNVPRHGGNHGFRDAHRARLIVFGVVTQDHALAGRGVPPGYLDVHVLDGENSGIDVDVAGTQSHKFSPTHPGLRGEHDHEPVVLRDRSNEAVELRRGENPHLLADHLG